VEKKRCGTLSSELDELRGWLSGKGVVPDTEQRQMREPHSATFGVALNDSTRNYEPPVSS